MKIFLRILRSRTFACGIGALVLLVALHSIGLKHDLSASDWATWTGGLGTVATLAGTIWIATDTSRQQKREQTDLAVIAAAEFAFKIHAMQDTLQNIIARLPSARNGAYADTFQACYEQLHAADIWDANSLKPLVIVRGHLAANLAFTATRIKAICGDLIEARNAELLYVKDVIEVERILKLKLDVAIDELKSPARACDEFLRKHNFFNTPLL